MTVVVQIKFLMAEQKQCGVAGVAGDEPCISFQQNDEPEFNQSIQSITKQAQFSETEKL